MYQNIVILTGAGISAESGIPVFRSETGLWEQERVEDVATYDGFLRDKTKVHEFYNKMRRSLLDKKPNPAHLALARLEKEYSKISLNLIVKDIRESTICLLKNVPENLSGGKFLYEGKAVKTSSFTQIFDLAQDLKNTISVIIDQVDREQKIANEREKESKTGADELLKYHELLEKGIITTNEFNEIKRKILSR